MGVYMGPLIQNLTGDICHNAYTDGCGVRIVAHFNTNAYMHEQSTMGFGVRIVAGNTLTGVLLFYLTASVLVPVRTMPHGRLTKGNSSTPHNFIQVWKITRVG